MPHRFMIAAALIVWAAPVLAESPEEVRKWAETVLVGMEYDAKVETCRRWVSGPKLAVVEGREAERKLVGELVGHLNETLAKTPIKRIEIVKTGDAGVNLRVFFVPKGKFAELSEAYGIKSGSDKDDGRFWISWNAKHEIEKGYVFLASDRLDGARMRHTALEEITQSLGLANDSPAFRDSIFYELGNDYGSAEKLSPRDKRLIQFFYNHVRPGDRRAQLQAAWDRHWSSK